MKCEFDWSTIFPLRELDWTGVRCRFWMVLSGDGGRLAYFACTNM